MGQFLAGLAIPFLVNELTDSNAWVGAVGFAGMIPAVALTPIGGVMSDRLDRRLMLMAAYALQIVGMSVLLGMYLADAITPWRILFLQLGLGCSGALQWPPVQAMPAITVPPESLRKAVQTLSISFTVGRALGPALAAITLVASGVGLALIVTIALYAIGIVLLLITRTRPYERAQSRSIVSEFRAGVAYVAARPSMRLAVVTAFMLATCLAVFSFPLAASIADDVFSTGAGGLGVLATSLGIGSIFGSIWMSLGGAEVLRSRTEVGALTAYLLGVLLVVATSWLPVGIAGYLLMGLGHMLHNVSMSTTLQVQVSEEFRGRVMSVWIFAILCGLPIGTILGGFLADALDIRIVAVIYASIFFCYFAITMVRTNRFAPINFEPAPERS